MPATSPSPNSSPTTVAPATSPPPPSNSSVTTTTTPPSTPLNRPNQNSHPPPQPALPPSPQPPATPPPPTSLPAPPPPATTASPPIVNSPPSQDVSPPPPSAISPPPVSPPPPPRTRSPPPQPPPANIPSPPHAKTPENSPRPPQPPIPSPSGSPPSPPPSNNSILPGSTLSPPSTSSSLPSTPMHKPTAKSTPTSNITATKPPNSGGTKQGGAITIGIIVGFLALSLLVLAIWYTRKRKRKGSRLNSGYIMPSPLTSSVPSPKESVRLGTSGSGTKFMYSQDPGGVGKSRPWFTYEELSEATNGFSASNLLGEGGFGSVYKGFLRGGKEVAVKQLKIGGGQGEREFMAEVEIISRVHHRHLVSLVGYCIYQNQRLLVFDYVPNNTLHYHLHGEGRLVVMNWETRVKVAAGAARGIAYLHEDCHPRIIHRDIKSSNILLDNNFDALVADFGLAKLTLDTYTHVTTRVMGTFGYVAPEYASSGKLSEKSDVYSFGVVLLELITGRKPVDSSRPVGQESLVEWARPLLKQALDDQNFEELVDTKLNNEFDKIEMYRMIEAAAACVRHLASKRPRMSQVVRALDSIFELSDLTNGMRPGQSEVFEAREHSAQIRMLQRMAFGGQDYSSEIFSHSQNSWRRL